MGCAKYYFDLALVFFLTISLVNTEKRMVLFFLAYFLFCLKMSQHGAITWAFNAAFHFLECGVLRARQAGLETRVNTQFRC